MTGWVVGSQIAAKRVFISATKDGGKTWETVTMEREGQLNSVIFTDAKRGRAFGSHALAYVTSDGGANWEKERAPGDCANYAFRDGLGCLVLGSSGYSRNRGVRCFWNDDLDQSHYRSKGGGSSLGGRKAQVMDENTVWVFDDTRIFLSTDRGLTWKKIRLEETVDGSSVVAALMSAYFLDPDRGWFAYRDGSMRFTSDGGTTRKPLNAKGINGRVPYHVHFFDERHGVMLVSSERDSTSILITEDGGENWQNYKTFDDPRWKRIFVLDSQHVWLAGRQPDGVRIQCLRLPF
jgi:photosystem II stability/assembly factor-like uncharacterized protein